MVSDTALVVKLVLDTLSSFCLSVHPTISTQLWWSNWGGTLKFCNLTEQPMKIHTSYVDTNNKSGRITNLVFHPVSADTMFACGLMMQGVYRSTDRGVTWLVVLRKKYKHTWYSGESLHCAKVGGGVCVVAASFSLGTIDWSYDLGNTWNTYQSASTNSFCSIVVLSYKPLVVIGGTRTGKVIRIEVDKGIEYELWQTKGVDYLEIPRIRLLDSTRQNIAFITAGYDSQNRANGLVVMSLDSSKLLRTYMNSISLWGMEVCDDDIIVGGFSEFEFVKGAGTLAIVSLNSGAVFLQHPGDSWDVHSPSVWDIRKSVSADGKMFLAAATEQGVYVLVPGLQRSTVCD